MQVTALNTGNIHVCTEEERLDSMWKILDVNVSGSPFMLVVDELKVQTYE